MRKVTVWDFLNASHTVTACGSVRRRIGPARIRGNVGNRSAIGVQDMIELLCHMRGIAGTWRKAFQVPHSLHEVSFRRCCLIIVSNTKLILVSAMNEKKTILGPKRSSVEWFGSPAIISGASEGNEHFSKGCMICNPCHDRGKPYHYSTDCQHFHEYVLSVQCIGRDVMALE